MRRWIPELIIFFLLVVLGLSVVFGRPDRALDSGILAVLGFSLGAYMARR